MPTALRAYPRPFRPVIVALLLFIALPATATVQSQMPDFYAEPGLNPFRDPLSANVNEVIDTFSGGLHLRYTDLVIPGNGGLDIRIQRSYNSNNVYLARKTALNLAPTLTTLLSRTPVGMGWTMHFGRVLKSEDASGVVNVCDAGTPGDDTLNNALLELPDGSQQILYVNSTPFSARFITREQWVADCITGGLLVTSPEGVKYTMTQHVSGGNTYTTARDHAWYTTRIEDRNGNYLTLSYLALSSNKNALITSITASDGRVVNFGYLNSADPNNILLSSISANAQTWRYEYTPNVAGSGYYQLTRVVQPDGLSWTYQYHNKAAGVAGNKVLQQVTYPYGATVNYDYGYVCFMGVSCASVYDTFYSLVVATKTNGGRDVVPGTWTYNYSPTTTEDTTTVTFPGGRHVYKHVGSKLMFGGATTPGKTLWKIGLLKEQQTYNGATLVNRVVYTWDAPYAISNERYVRPPYDGSDASHPRYEDSAIYVPLLVRKDIIRDGTPYTTVYSNFVTADGSFNPQTITETGQAGRTTSLTYFPRIAGQNIVRQVKDETEPSSLCLGLPCPNRNILRTFDTKGNATQIVRHGVREDYSYYANGDLFRKTNARNFPWNYAGYVRGIPTNEVQPAGITLNRTVNPTGTIATETNGRGYTTAYTYDKMNRLTSIGRPLGTPTTIAWDSTGRTVTRGIYTQTTTLDGFGKLSLINTGGITQDINYNALGYKSFASYPSSALGDSYTTDVLGRVTAITHGDGTTQALQYLAGNRVSITNERNYSTALTYRAFGDPDNVQDKVLMQVSAPEGITTTFTRNILGQPLTITQGGITRTYGYDNTNNFLTSLTQPETGTTTFGRDAVGNMTARQVGGSSITGYVYDGLNRLTLIDYPGVTPDVTQGYDNNNNVTLVNNGIAQRNFSYDANDNLTAEALSTAGITYITGYAYNPLDYLTSITYPSLRQVNYAPDSLGRPTAASPYLTAVTHYPNGIPQQLQYANGQVADLTLNARQWIGRISAQKAGIGYVEDLSYGYDGLANVTSITNALDSTDGKTMGYDGVDRLISAGTASVSYDAADNITSMQLGTNGLTYSYSGNRLNSVTGYKNYTFTYDAYANVTANGQNTFLYDDAANLRTVGGVTTAQYDYDGNHLRVHQQKDGKDIYSVYLRNGRLLGEYNQAGTWLKEYAYLNDKLVTLAVNPDSDQDGIPDRNDNCAQVANPDQRDTNNDGYGNLCDADLNNDSATNTLDLNLFKLGNGSRLGDPHYNPDADFNNDGIIDALDLAIFQGLYRKAPGPSKVPTLEQLTYYHLDALGSPVAGTDAQGNVAWKETYQPYGERVQKQPGASSNTRWYTGHVLDSETGLQYAGARYYDPGIGRFMGVDPQDYKEGELHSFNRYAYGNNSPYKYVDPDGKESYLVSRPLGGDSKFFSHNFVVSNAKYVGDENATVYSYGENALGNTGRVDENTKGFSLGTHGADKDHWRSLSGNSNVAKKNITKINAEDARVDKQADSLIEDTDYAAIGASLGTGTNSNSAASAIANTSQRSKVAVPGGSRLSPGVEATDKIRFRE